ncbi:MAG: AbrB/MazE/SpoVT family DNA-binding domain-containing protein [Desulfobacteraceae bacterium]|nr:AbrB/MazE/SpoVT family DNA-binding domain-containing protein [Desulfobacteraceae bacterium]
MQTVRTLTKGQVVIPSRIRKHLAIEKGSLLEIALVGDHIEMRPVPADPIAAFCGSLKDRDSLAQGLIDEHRQEVCRDGKR